MKYFIGIFLLSLCWSCSKDNNDNPQDYFSNGEWKETLYWVPTNISKTDFPVSFNIDKDYYIGVWQYTDSPEMNGVVCRFKEDYGWSIVEKFPGRPRKGAVAFVIGGKAYVGLGVVVEKKSVDEYCTDFWQYDPVTNSWDSLLFEFPGKGREGAVAFVLENKGYVGTGVTKDEEIGGFHNLGDFYEFDPKVGWSKLENASVNSRSFATTFTLNDEAYLCFGEKHRDVLKFSVMDKKWKAMNPLKPDKFPDITRSNASSLVVEENGKQYAYVIGGNATVWTCRYDPYQDQWSEVEEGRIPKAHFFFSTGNQYYYINGINTWEFIPQK